MRFSSQPLPSRRSSILQPLLSSLNLESLYISSSAPPHSGKRNSSNTNAGDDKDAEGNCGILTFRNLSGGILPSYPNLCQNSCKEIMQDQQVPYINFINNIEISCEKEDCNFSLSTNNLHETYVDKKPGIVDNHSHLSNRDEHANLGSMCNSNDHPHIGESYEKRSEGILILSPLDSTNAALEQRVESHVIYPLSPFILLSFDNGITVTANDCNDKFVSKSVVELNSEIQTNEKYGHKLQTNLQELDESIHEPPLEKSNENCPETDGYLQDKNDCSQNPIQDLDEKCFPERNVYHKHSEIGLHSQELFENPLESNKLEGTLDDHLDKSCENLQTATYKLKPETCSQESDASSITFSPLLDDKVVKYDPESQMSNAIDAIQPPNCMERKDLQNCSQTHHSPTIHTQKSNGEWDESQMPSHLGFKISSRHSGDNVNEDTENATALSRLHKDDETKVIDMTSDGNDLFYETNVAKDEIICTSSNGNNLIDVTEKSQENTFESGTIDSVTTMDSYKQSLKESFSNEFKVQIKRHAENNICLENTVRSESLNVRESGEPMESFLPAVTEGDADNGIESILPASFPTEGMEISHTDHSLAACPEFNIMNFSPLTNTQGLIKVSRIRRHSGKDGSQHFEAPCGYQGTARLTDEKLSNCSYQSVNLVDDKPSRNQSAYLLYNDSNKNYCLEQNRPVVVPDITLSQNESDLFQSQSQRFIEERNIINIFAANCAEEIQDDSNDEEACKKSIAGSNDERHASFNLKAKGNHHDGNWLINQPHQSTSQKDVLECDSPLRAQYSLGNEQLLLVTKCKNTNADCVRDRERARLFEADCISKGCHVDNSDSCVSKSLQKDEINKICVADYVHNCTEGEDIDSEQVVPDYESLPCAGLTNNESFMNDLPSMNNKEMAKAKERSSLPSVYTWTPLFATDKDTVYHTDGLYVSGQATAIASLLPQPSGRRSIRIGLSKRQKVKRLHRHQ